MIAEALFPALVLPDDVFQHLWMLLPILPLAGALATMVARTFWQKDVSAGLLWVAVCLQLLLGATLLLFGPSLLDAPREMALSPWRYSIVFRADAVKLVLLGMLMVPLFISLPRYRYIETPYLRIVFLFFLSGCSGVIVTGDIFNFFVFYELMIMAAYVLVASRKNYAQAIKYMMFGSVSSVALLGGIVILYAGGAPFSVQAETFALIPEANAWWAMLLFTVAFGVKSAFFPIALAPCHAAAGSPFSAFLASFTIFTGMMGLHYYVLEPAAVLGWIEFHDLIRLLALITIFMASLMLFWEPDYRRAVAQSTIIAVGFSGLLLALGAGRLAFVYVLVHALYKSLLFTIADDLEQTVKHIRARSLWTFGLTALAVFLAAGLYPGLPVLFKSLPVLDAWGMKWLFLFSSACVLGGFAKFRYVHEVSPDSTHSRWPTVYLVVAVSALLAFYYIRLGIPPWVHYAVALDVFVVVVVALFARRIFRRFPLLVSMDRHWIYGKLNRQLLYMLLLFCFTLVWLQVFR